MPNDIEKLRQFLIKNPYFNLSRICIKLGFQKQLLMNFVSKGYGLGNKEQEEEIFEFFRNFGYNDTEIDKEKIQEVTSKLNENLLELQNLLPKQKNKIMKRPDFEIINEKKYPILWRKKGSEKTDVCLFCNQTHIHSKGEGHRVKHCLPTYDNYGKIIRDISGFTLSDGTFVEPNNGYIIREY